MIEKIWSGESPLWRLLLPLSWLYGLVSGAIRLCYKLKLKRAWRAPVPVVVVGNLTAGGNGKTSVVVWLVEQLQQRGIRVGSYRGDMVVRLNLIRCYCRQIPPQHRRVMNLC